MSSIEDCFTTQYFLWDMSNYSFGENAFDIG